MLSIPNQLEAAYIGQDVTLECHIEAFPTAINYWTTENGDMIVSGNARFYCTRLSFTMARSLHLSFIVFDIFKLYIGLVETRQFVFNDFQVFEASTFNLSSTYVIRVNERANYGVSGDKYVTVFSDNDYTKYMLLKIRNVSQKDFGSYKCVAQNSLGATDGVIKLDGESI